MRLSNALFVSCLNSILHSRFLFHLFPPFLIISPALIHLLGGSPPSTRSRRDNMSPQPKLTPSSVSLPLHPSLPPPTLSFGCPPLSLTLSLSLLPSPCINFIHIYEFAPITTTTSLLLALSFASPILSPLNPPSNPPPSPPPSSLLSHFLNSCIRPPLWQDHLAAAEGLSYSRCGALNDDHRRTGKWLERTHTHTQMNTQKAAIIAPTSLCSAFPPLYLFLSSLSRKAMSCFASRPRLKRLI